MRGRILSLRPGHTAGGDHAASDRGGLHGALGDDPVSGARYLVQLFLTRSFRKLPVVDTEGRVIGQVSRRDARIAIESIADNSYLYGTADRRPPDDGGVDSAMKIARGQK